MKIKKIFGLVTVASLAVLMTACGKKAKNESVMNEDFVSSYSISMDDLKESMKAKKLETIFSDKEYVDDSEEVIIVKDSTNYYVYNMILEEQLVLTLPITDITDVSIDYNVIMVVYDTNSDGDSAKELYLPNGKCILSKTYCSDIDIDKVKDGGAGSLFEHILYERYNFMYSVRVKTEGEPDSFETIYGEYYCLTIINEKGQEYSYLDKDEFHKEYGKAQGIEIDGKAVGLDGYTIKQTSDDSLYLLKKGKVVNTIKEVSGIISDGYALYQTKKIVTLNDDYDVFYNNKYYVVDTYKLNLKTSKITKLKNFKYVITTDPRPIVSKDKTEIIGYRTKVYDYTNKKAVTSEDLKAAVVKGNGSIKIQEALTPALKNGNVVYDGDKYYSYDTTKYTTTVFDKSGNILDVYQGIYYDDVLVQRLNTTYSFFDKDGKALVILYGGTGFVNFSQYIGYDLLGKQVLVTISNGNITITDITDYEYENYYFKRENSDATGYDLYSLDSTLTSLEFTIKNSDDVDHAYQTTTRDFYIIEHEDGDYSLICFK